MTVRRPLTGLSRRRSVSRSPRSTAPLVGLGIPRACDSSATRGCGGAVRRTQRRRPVDRSPGTRAKVARFRTRSMAWSGSRSLSRTAPARPDPPSPDDDHPAGAAAQGHRGLGVHRASAAVRSRSSQHGCHVRGPAPTARVTASPLRSSGSSGLEAYDSRPEGRPRAQGTPIPWARRRGLTHGLARYPPSPWRRNPTKRLEVASTRASVARSRRSSEPWARSDG